MSTNLEHPEAQNTGVRRGRTLQLLHLLFTATIAVSGLTFGTLVALGLLKVSVPAPPGPSPLPPPAFQIEPLKEVDTLVHQLSWGGRFFKDESCRVWAYRYSGGPIICWVENDAGDVHETLGPFPSFATWRRIRKDDLVKREGYDLPLTPLKSGYIVLGAFKGDNYRLFLSVGGQGAGIELVQEKRFTFREGPDDLGGGELSGRAIPPFPIEAGQEVTILWRKFGGTKQEVKVKFLTEDELAAPVP